MEAMISIEKARVYADIIRDLLIRSSIFIPGEYVQYTFENDLEDFLRKISNQLDDLLSR